MNKTAFIDEMASRLNVSRAEAERVVNTFTDVVTEALTRGDEVNITGFGAFRVTHRKAREGVNPKTGERIQIAATKSAKFKAGKGLQDAVKAS